jgi:hypothetical protein
MFICFDCSPTRCQEYLIAHPTDYRQPVLKMGEMPGSQQIIRNLEQAFNPRNEHRAFVS